MRELIVRIALKIGIYKKLLNLENIYNQKKMAKNFRKRGLDTLIKADTLFKSLNIQMFPVFGTLLGVYREKGFIPHDNDLDVGIMSSERPANLDELMSEIGFKKKRQYYSKETGRITEDQFHLNGVQIDIFYFFEKDIDTIYCYVARQHENKDWREANRTDGLPSVLWPSPQCRFIEENFMGHKIYMPEKAAEWLAGIYGKDFMTPKVEWSEQDQKTNIIYHTERLYRR